MLRLVTSARLLRATGVVPARCSATAAACASRRSLTVAAAQPQQRRRGWPTAAALLAAAGASIAWTSTRSVEAEAEAAANHDSEDAAAAAASGSASAQRRFRSAQPCSDPEHAGLTLLVADQVEDLVWKRNRPNAINSMPEEIREIVAAQRPVGPSSSDATWSDVLATAAAPRSSSSSSSSASSNNDASVFSPLSSSLPSVTPLFTPYSVLVDVYDPECGACATLKPVMDALAWALHSTPSVRVMTYDDEANRKAGFLSLQERSALPLLKFYPPLEYDGEGEPVSEEAKHGIVYTGDPSPLSLLRFIVAHTPPSFAFDAVAVERRLQSKAAETDAAVMVAVTNRLRNDRGFSLYENSPCGPPMLDWMRMSIASRYSSVFDDSGADDESAHGATSPEGVAFKSFQTCMQTKEKAIREYWEQTLSVAQENLERYKDEAKPAADTTPALKDGEKTHESQWG